MFTPEFYIDAIQNAKRQVVDTFVQDEKIKAGLHSYITAQTEFVKVVAKNSVDFTQLAVQNAFKADFTKYFNQK